MSSLEELVAIMVRLRAADGCPWDRAQTFATIAPFTVEESYEVADAAERGDMHHLKEELGDLLFQVVFHSQMGSEAGHFDLGDVITGIRDKLMRRHPQLFGDRSPDAGAPRDLSAQTAQWENIKAAERAGVEQSALAGVPLALPALMRAFKLSKRAARVGFDFAEAAATADKVAEELAEVREAAAADSSRRGAPSPEIFEEMGDLLFAAANLARKLGVDPEAALRAANAKFERRFRGMERLAAESGENFETLGLIAQEALWQEVKRGE